MPRASWFVDENSVDIEELIAEDLENLEHRDGTPHSYNQPQLPHDYLAHPTPNCAESNAANTNGTLRKARTHFENILNQLTCVPTRISFHNHFPLATSFSSFEEDDRQNLVRDCSKAISKRNAQQRSSARSYNSTRYQIRGKWVCQFGFAAVVQLYPRTVRAFAVTVAEEKKFSLHRNEHCKGRKGKHSLQTVTALAFLRGYAALNALACPTGRGSEEEYSVQWLSSDVRKEVVYLSYKESWLEILQAAAADSVGVQLPQEPLSRTGFLKVWRCHYPTLRIFKAGSDFCDQCTTLVNSARSTKNDDLRETLLNARLRHRKEALEEFVLYRTIQATSASSPAASPIHLIFDFAEKVLLPHLLRQPGQLHFVTGLKFDIFGVYSSSFSHCYVYGLPEGHWFNNKTCNEVDSMLHHAINEHHRRGVITEHHKRIRLHADNCSGQNKNRFMLWYLLWRICMGHEEEITLYFLVAGHTKNRCDAAFGLVKRRLKQLDVFGPQDMMKVLHSSSCTNQAVNAKEVTWLDWKALLKQFYTIPNNFKLSNYHVFRFSKGYSEGVMVKHLSSDTCWTRYKLVKRAVTGEMIRAASLLRRSGGGLLLSVTPLSEVPSAQDHNREAYLFKNVLERYYRDDDNRRKLYFASGEDWKNAL